MSARLSAFIACLLLLPAGIMLASIVFHIEAVETFMKSFLTEDGETPSVLGRAYMLFALLALPVSLVLAVWPMLRKGANGQRSFYLANALVALIALILLVPIVFGIGEEVYRCDILKIPNCD
jgi:hypothetical protein